MSSRFRLLVVPVLAAALTLVLRADGVSSQSAEVQLQLGDLLYSEGRYLESLEAYRNATKAAAPDLMGRARSGFVNSALRVAEFDGARTQAEMLVHESPRSPQAMALYGDALWASGLFEQAELQYRAALTITPDLPRGHHGMARSLAARGRVADAMTEAQSALRLSPRDLEIHHTVGTLFERLHKFEEAANAYTNYVNLLPNKDTSSTAAWSRAEIKFLQSFGQRVPFDTEPGTEDKVYTMPFRLVNDKVVVRAKVNDALSQDFVVDTGSENTVITRPTALRLAKAGWMVVAMI